MGSTTDSRKQCSIYYENSFYELKKEHSEGDSKLTDDEVRTLDNALRQAHFRNLLAEHAQEISDPEIRAQREKEIEALEKDRGFKVEFLYPQPGYVLKCWTDYGIPKKMFINICAEDKVTKASSETNRSFWNIWSLLSQPREDFDKSGHKCVVYDAMFHPDVLKIAESNSKVRKFVENTALKSVQSNFCVKVNQNKIKYPKIKYKGTAGETVIRTKIEYSDNRDVNDSQGSENGHVPLKGAEAKPAAEVPKYQIRHRSEVSLHDFRNVSDSNTSARPKELVIEINLPLIGKASEIKLDIAQSKLHMESYGSKSYKLDVNLPYLVNDDKGKAEFNKDSSTLSVVLPLISAPDLKSWPPSSSGNSLDVNHSDTVTERIEDTSKNYKEINTYRTSLGDGATHLLPPYECYFQTSDHVVFVLDVKNVNKSCLVGLIEPFNHGYDLIFLSTGSSYAPLRYSFCLRFDDHEVGSADVVVSSNNVMLKLEKKDKSAEMWKTFYAGIDDLRLSEKHFLTDNSLKDRLHKLAANNESWWKNQDDLKVQVLNANEMKLKNIKIPEPVEELPEIESDGHNVEQLTRWEEAKMSVRPRKTRSMSESATDDMGKKRQGILKVSRSLLGRTVSESSDEISHSSLDSMSDLHKSQSSPDIPEEDYSTEDADKPKKHVRFLDKVSKNLYRSNSSILGQRKKNQRKVKNKKKNALKRSNSEGSSCSETELVADSPDLSLTHPSGFTNELCRSKRRDGVKPAVLITDRINELIDQNDDGILSDNSSSGDVKWIKTKSKKSKRRNRKMKKAIENSFDSGAELDCGDFNPELYELN